MTSQPQDRMTLLMLVFDDDPQAHAALQELKALNRAQRIKIKAAAVVTKKFEGKTKVKPKVLALIEPLWIQDFIQALLQTPLSSAPRQMTIGLDLNLDNPAHSPLSTDTPPSQPPPMEHDGRDTALPAGD
jgi:hypothetical protein